MIVAECREDNAEREEEETAAEGEIREDDFIIRNEFGDNDDSGERGERRR